MAHVGCCLLLLSTTALSCIVDKIDYVVCRGFWQVVHTYILWYKKKKGVNVGHPRHNNVVSGSILCRHDRAVLAKSANIWLLGRHVANMSATLPAKDATVPWFSPIPLIGCQGTQKAMVSMIMQHKDGDGDGRHDDGKGHQGNRWQDDGDERHDDRRHNNGKGQQGSRQRRHAG